MIIGYSNTKINFSTMIKFKLMQRFTLQTEKGQILTFLIQVLLEGMKMSFQDVKSIKFHPSHQESLQLSLHLWGVKFLML